MIVEHIRIWLIITIFSIFVTPAIVDKQTYGSHIKSEQAALIESLGEDSGMKIIRKTDAIYNGLFISSGLQDWALKHYAHQDPSDSLLGHSKISDGSRKIGQYVVAFFMNIYEGIFRSLQLMYWLTFAGPFVLAAAFDGFMLRKIRIATFHYSSPAVYNSMWHVMIVIFFGTLIYCDSPLPIYPMTFPVLLLVIAMMVRAMLANLQRSA